MNIINNIKTARCQNRRPKKSVIKNQGMSKKTWVSFSRSKFEHENYFLSARLSDTKIQ